jgi:hypothetical protein
LEKRQEDRIKDFRARPELEVGCDMQVEPLWSKARDKQSIIHIKITNEAAEKMQRGNLAAAIFLVHITQFLRNTTAQLHSKQ